MKVFILVKKDRVFSIGRLTSAKRRAIFFPVEPRAMAEHTAESGEEYLNSMNFRSLIEWVTAEALLTRPEDPLAFTRTIIDKKLAQVC